MYSQDISNYEELDSLQILHDLTNDEKLAFNKRIEYANEAVKLARQSYHDSLYLKSSRNLSTLYLREGFYDSLKRPNTLNLQLATKLNDTMAMAFAGYNLGFYYEYKLKNDSAYFHYFNAQKLFRIKGDKSNQAGLLLNMANIQETERDYIGSEINAINAIKLIKTLPSTEDNNYKLWSLNNLIGIISNELKLYEKSIEYHNNALFYASKMEDNYRENNYSKSNIAWIYKQQEKYDEAIKLFNNILQDENLKSLDPGSYSSILSSISYCNFLAKKNNSKAIIDLFHESLKISEAHEEKVVTMSTCLYFAEYYSSIKETDSALWYVNRSFNIANQISSNETILDILMLKSKITEGDVSKKYLNEYIKLNDSLINKERSIRNKFARIDYETDQIIAEKDQVTAEKDQANKERLMFLLLSIGLFITLTLLYIIITQRSKNKELKFIQQQQETNEEIYNLMLSEQDNIEEARTMEKRRISAELHDGILGRLFGTRLSLDSLNMSHTEEAVKSRENYIDELQAIEQEIRKVSHDLNSDFVSGSGFNDIIKTLLETQTKAYKLKYKFTNKDAIQWDTVSNKTKIHIYRILQESLQNIYKHANASLVEISFSLKNNVICFTIKDDGSGFDINKSRKGIGIKNITSRVKEIEGELEIQSQKELGTSIIINVPTKAS